ncbi:hypothetical protein D3C72_2157400 [compost metagenome]
MSPTKRLMMFGTISPRNGTMPTVATTVAVTIETMPRPSVTTLLKSRPTLRAISSPMPMTVKRAAVT